MRKFPIRRQYLISLLLIILISGICYFIVPFFGYRVVSLILLVTVSLIAISFDILPVLVSAVMSAFVWNFFFIPPRFTFHVGTAEDVTLFIMYFIIAMINAALTYKIRRAERVSRTKEEKANTLKLYDTLLHSLSHELKTPITTIVAATDNLQMNNSMLTSESKRQLVAELSKASLRLSQQVDKLLNMSRLESGFITPKKDWCDLNELIYSVLNKIEEDFPTHKINIELDDHFPLIKTDTTILEQIIFNLLQNACLYTEENTLVTISAAARNNILKLVITDQGKGFPEQEMDKVFDRFYRLKGTKTGGTGLGLSIVKGFVDVLGGNISLKNRSTGGAQFTITIACDVSDLKA